MVTNLDHIQQKINIVFRQRRMEITLHSETTTDIAFISIQIEDIPSSRNTNICRKQ